MTAEQVIEFFGPSERLCPAGLPAGGCAEVLRQGQAAVRGLHRVCERQRLFQRDERGVSHRRPGISRRLGSWTTVPDRLGWRVARCECHVGVDVHMGGPHHADQRSQACCWQVDGWVHQPDTGKFSASVASFSRPTLPCLIFCVPGSCPAELTPVQTLTLCTRSAVCQTPRVQRHNRARQSGLPYCGLLGCCWLGSCDGARVRTPGTPSTPASCSTSLT